MRKRHLWLLIFGTIALFSAIALVSCNGSNSGDDDDDGGDDDDDGEINPLCVDICEALAYCDQGGDGCEQQCSTLDQEVIECYHECVDASESCEDFEACMTFCDNPGPPQDDLGTDIGDTMENFTLLNEKDEEVSLYDYYGKVLLVIESSANCPYCADEAGSLEQDLYQPYKDQGFEILLLMAANYAGAEPDASFLSGYKDRYEFTFQILGDYRAGVMGKYNDDGYVPFNMLVDKNMVIRDKSTGYWPNYLSMKIEDYLEEDGPF